jgi:BirA family transcriptional regulator, biotin operon repressor / biotin---[acetyl-CoA-carboxylase] ligase
VSLSSLPVRHYELIDSTNAEARRLFEAGECRSAWIRSDVQTAGRGRLGRAWQSGHGNLYTTLLLATGAPPVTLPQVGFVVALAVADVAQKFVDSSDIHLKWPNDCLIRGAKFSGILAEILDSSAGIVAIGCGINIAHVPGGLPYAVTALAHYGQANCDTVFEDYKQAMSRWFAVWDEGRGFAAIVDAWTGLAIGFGEDIEVDQQGQLTRGRYVGLDASGGLLLDDEHGTRHCIFAGDVRIPSLTKLRQLRNHTT